MRLFTAKQKDYKLFFQELFEKEKISFVKIYRKSVKIKFDNDTSNYISLDEFIERYKKYLYD